MYVESDAGRAEDAGRRGDMKTLYKITRSSSGRFRDVSVEGAL